MASKFLEPQAALETAILNAIRASLDYPQVQTGRTYDGQPPPRVGNWFVAVWGDNGRASQSRTALDEVFSAYVTITARFTKPFDKWVEHRDDLEVRVNEVRALIHADSYNYAIVNAANVLAGYRTSSQGGTDTAPSPTVVGFCEGLMLDGIDPIREVGPDWFHAEQGNTLAVGIAQTMRFKKARHVQNMKYMV